MADAVASCSDSWVTTTDPSTTFTQPMRMSRQSVTRVGSKRASTAIVARDSNVDRWTALFSDVLSIHEIHCKSNKVVFWSSPCPGVEGALNNRVYSLCAEATDGWTTARPRRRAGVLDAIAEAAERRPRDTGV